MPTPYLGYFGSMDEDLRDLRVGPLRLWFAMGVLVAFQHDDERMVAREEPFPEDAELVAKVPGVRFAEVLKKDLFEKAWERASDPYLYPERKGKITRDWPDLRDDIPPGILADWLEENGCKQAAELLRNAEKWLETLRGVNRIWVKDKE